MNPDKDLFSDTRSTPAWETVSVDVIDELTAQEHVLSAEQQKILHVFIVALGKIFLPDPASQQSPEDIATDTLRNIMSVTPKRRSPRSADQSAVAAHDIAQARLDAFTNALLAESKKRSGTPQQHIDLLIQTLRTLNLSSDQTPEALATQFVETLSSQPAEYDNQQKDRAEALCDALEHLTSEYGAFFTRDQMRMFELIEYAILATLASDHHNLRGIEQVSTMLLRSIRALLPKPESKSGLYEPGAILVRVLMEDYIKNAPQPLKEILSAVAEGAYYAASALDMASLHTSDINNKAYHIVNRINAALKEGSAFDPGARSLHLNNADEDETHPDYKGDEARAKEVEHASLKQLYSDELKSSIKQFRTILRARRDAREFVLNEIQRPPAPVRASRVKKKGEKEEGDQS